MSISPEWLIAIGIAVTLSELALMLFVPIWYGIGLILTGLLGYLAHDLPVFHQLAIAAILGTILMFAFRKRFFRPKDEVDPPSETYKTGTTGKLNWNQASGVFQVMVNGTYWRVGNEETIGTDALTKNVGKSVKILKLEGTRAIIGLNEKNGEDCAE